MPQDQNTVRDGHDLMQLVRDEDHRQPPRDSLAQRLKKRIGFLGRKHSGGFVQNKNARVAIERLQDLDALAFSDRQGTDFRAGINGQSEVLRKLHHARMRLLAATAQGPERRGTQKDVVENGQVVGQGKVLVHHADSGLQCCNGFAGRELATKCFDTSKIGRILAEKDVHQRGLARPVLAQQSHDLTPPQGQADRVVRRQRAKAFRDVFEAENDVFGRGHQIRKMRVLRR